MPGVAARSARLATGVHPALATPPVLSPMEAPRAGSRGGAVGSSGALLARRAGVADAVDAGRHRLVATGDAEAVRDAVAARRAVAVASATPTPAAVAEAEAVLPAHAGLAWTVRGGTGEAGAFDARDQIRLVAAGVVAVGVARAGEGGGGRRRLADNVATAVPAPAAIAEPLAVGLSRASNVGGAGVALALDEAERSGSSQPGYTQSESVEQSGAGGKGGGKGGSSEGSEGGEVDGVEGGGVEGGGADGGGVEGG
eukprot:CAMPEP_0183336582 /NCGR_PEP_ID=MMETSP0164_2-20130417/4518_1 /TAXON_ID=221442 /ORGANISM="Coccolithus pelagicus ssp braarudi, Strain PLY182g" /LENGTH=254 /DNA_ID=CAMNT_0025506129 /DNA_START=283 /DNA_END=1044 /DNA_ORIENTATION=+